MLSFTIGKETISLFFEGQFNSIDRDHINYETILTELRKEPADRDYDVIRHNVSTLAMIERLNYGRVSITDKAVLFEGTQIGSYMAERMLELMHDGINVEPYAAFMDNVFDNPATYVRDELYQWMEKAKLPITPDGHLLAFKKVRDDYMDCHTGMFSNAPGTILEMDRKMCNPNRNVHCSTGFHFCSVDYLSSFGGQRVVVVKINPEHVTSIPSDYAFTKGRCHRYEVIAELSSEDAARHGVWAKSVVDLADPTEFPAEVLSQIKFAEEHSEVVQADADPSTRETWEAWDEEGVEAALEAGALTAQQAAIYFTNCKTRYDNIFDRHGELLRDELRPSLDEFLENNKPYKTGDRIFIIRDNYETGRLATVSYVDDTGNVWAHVDRKPDDKLAVVKNSFRLDNVRAATEEDERLNPNVRYYDALDKVEGEMTDAGKVTLTKEAIEKAIDEQGASWTVGEAVKRGMGLIAPKAGDPTATNQVTPKAGVATFFTLAGKAITDTMIRKAVKEGGSTRGAAAILGIAESTLRGWRKVIN